MSTIILFLSVLCLTVVGGSNILLDKPSTMPNGAYSPSGNDGVTGGIELTCTGPHPTPYWQGDLQGFYTIYNITLTSGFMRAEELRNAYVGVSQSEFTCPGSEMTICGQWPDDNHFSTALTFACPSSPPARYITVWREPVAASADLCMAEVEAEGVEARPSQTAFINHPLKKVSAYYTVTVSGVIDCATKCHQNQPCVAMSYSPATNDCLLATDVTMTTEPGWKTYQIRTCF